MAHKHTSKGFIPRFKKLLRDKDGDEEVIDQLQDPAVANIVDGFMRFKTCIFDQHPDIFNQLAKEQKPKFLVFACSDSRVSPSHVLDFHLGEAFMASNIGNLVPAFNQLRYSDVGAVIEYAVSHLKVENILVMGHSRCGGIERLMELPGDGSTKYDFVDDWVKIALPAKIKVKAQYPHLSLEKQKAKCEREAVNLSLSNLLTYPYVQKGLENKSLALRGGHYDFVEGKFELWEFKAVLTPTIKIPPSNFGSS
ncbi:hypothetical protein LWI28_023865 [Acer negundo]|uniref:Carbonic anhydrase n=1 Tax=Acer negundo TaxID=4023 RepID=A0AAD5IRJ2_ACENE|nr:hypothetical protein LWI28_023865 [Acer negundo]